MGKDKKSKQPVLAPAQRRKSSPLRQGPERLENSEVLESGFDALVSPDGAGVLEGASDGGDAPYRTGEVVGTWHGSLSDAELIAAEPLEAEGPVSEPLSLAGALALARASAGAAVIVGGGESYVVHSLRTTAWTQGFTADNVIIPGGGSTVTAVDGVVAFVTEDGHVIQAAGLRRNEQPDPSVSFEANDAPAKGQETPVSGLTEAFGEGLSDFTNEEGEVADEDRDALLRAFQIALQDVARDRLEASRLEAENIQAGVGMEETKAVAGLLVAPLLTYEKLQHEASGERLRAFPMQGAGAAELRLSEADLEERIGAQKRLEGTAQALQDQQKIIDQIVARAPILAGMDAGAVQQIADGDEEAVKGRATEVLANIETAQGYVTEDPEQLWAVPRLVEWTSLSLGLGEGGAGRVVADHAAEVKGREETQQFWLTVLGVGLALVAVAMTAGAAFAAEGSAAAAALGTGSAGVAGVSAGMGVWDFALNAGMYDRKSSLAGTDVNPEESIVDPAEVEGQLAWLAVSLVGIGIDAADAVVLVKMFKAGTFTSNAEVVDELVRLGAAPDAAAELAQKMGATGDLGRWTGVLKGVSDPGATKTLDRAWEAAGTHDIKGMEAAFSAVEDGLDPATRAAAWEELTQRLWESSLSPVRMAGEHHNLRIGYEAGNYVLLLCSDCAALGKTLAWLKSHPAITGNDDALQQVVALEKALAPKLAQLDNGVVPNTDDIRTALEELGARYDIGCLSCMVDAGAAGLKGGFETTLDMVGKPLTEVQGSKAFKEHYVLYERDGVMRIRRADGQTEEMPELVVDDNGIVSWRPNQSTRPSKQLDVVADLAELEQNLVGASESVGRYLRTARNLGVPEDVIQAALAKGRDTVGEGTHPVDRIRTLLKNELRPKMLARIVGEEGDAAGSVKRLNQACATLNAGDQGQLAEEWVIAHRVKHEGDSADNYITQVFMDQKDNPGKGMSADRKPDLGIRENAFGDFEINEVKSGTAELSPDHDIPQIEDMLMATANGGGVVRKGAETYGVEEVVLTFTDIAKPMQPNTSKKLAEWLDTFPQFSFEVFDANGASVTISSDNLRSLLQESGSPDLARLLRHIKEGSHVVD